MSFGIFSSFFHVLSKSKPRHLKFPWTLPLLYSLTIQNQAMPHQASLDTTVTLFTDCRKKDPKSLQNHSKNKTKNPVTFVTGFSGWLQGFEPWASRATIWRANQLRYSHHYEFLELFVLNEPEGIRTPDPRLRRPLLYPAELRTHINCFLQFKSG